MKSFSEEVAIIANLIDGPNISKEHAEYCVNAGFQLAVRYGEEWCKDLGHRPSFGLLKALKEYVDKE